LGVDDAIAQSEFLVAKALLGIGGFEESVTRHAFNLPAFDWGTGLQRLVGGFLKHHNNIGIQLLGFQRHSLEILGFYHL
jgi:hypothetical protein